MDLETRGVGKRFGEVVALDDVSFTLRGPGLVCVLGPNGAGKTTLLDLLEGLTEPSSGDVRLFGGIVTPEAYPRTRVGVVMQREFVMEAVTVGDYAELFAAIYRVEGGKTRILERARLQARSSVSVERLSGGEAQRLFIAAASVHEPDILLLDEPTGALDPENKRTVGELLRELAKKALVVMTTHDLDEASHLADELLFLFDGKLKAQGTKATLLAQVEKDNLREAFFALCGSTITSGGEAF